MNNQDKYIFEKGRKIAEDISSVMLNENQNRKHLDEWLLENKFSQIVVDKFTSEEMLSESIDNFSQNKMAVVKRLSLEIDRKTRLRKRFFTFVSSAAAVAVISFLLIYVDKTHFAKIDNFKDISFVMPDTLTIPKIYIKGGEEVYLTENVTIDGGMAIISGDSLNYAKVDQEVVIKEELTAYNKLVLPKKCTLVVTLSDGTKVYLNANSTLEYPTVFSGETREVNLSGEAFFEVKKNSGKPFIVNSGETKIQVYGTKFNVNSYDLQRVRTSLVSGSVGVKTKNNDEVFIKPEQMLIVNSRTGENYVTSFNPNKYEAWLSGFFRCDHEPIVNILEDISRWYGIEFDYEFEESKKIKLSASISRERPIEEVFELLNSVSGVNFSKKGGNKYTVK